MCICGKEKLNNGWIRVKAVLVLSVLAKLWVTKSFSLWLTTRVKKSFIINKVPQKYQVWHKSTDFC